MKKSMEERALQQKQRKRETEQQRQQNSRGIERMRQRNQTHRGRGHREARRAVFRVDLSGNKGKS